MLKYNSIKNYYFNIYIYIFSNTVYIYVRNFINYHDILVFFPFIPKVGIVPFLNKTSLPLKFFFVCLIDAT